MLLLLCLKILLFNYVAYFSLWFSIYSIPIGFLIQELRSNQFWRLLAKPVHSFQDRVNYHRRMHFFQGLKQKAFAKLMPFQRSCSYLYSPLTWGIKSPTRLDLFNSMIPLSKI